MAAERAVAAGFIAIVLVGGACSSPAPPATVRTRDAVQFVPEPSVGPFVVVAVDNHFHDIHPVDRTRIAEDRPFIVKNEGRNLHNFTVVGTGISVDIKPGHQLVWPRLGDELPPGSYTVVCKYHAYQSMTGSFVVTP